MTAGLALAVLLHAAITACTVAHAQIMRRVISPLTVELANGSPYLNPFSGGLWQPRTGLRDVNGDGRPDIFTLNPDGELRMYRNDGSLRFHRVLPSPYDSLPVNSWFRFADLDGDNDAEILTSGERSEVLIMYNEGTDASPQFVLPPVYLTAARADSLATLDSIRTQRETVPSLVDIDADGDVDLFAGNIDGSISFYENIGTPQSASFLFRTSKFEGIQVIGEGIARERDEDGLMRANRHGASVLDFADLDGDGDLDILFGDFFTTRLLHFTNTGTPQSPRFSMSALDTAFRPTGDDVESQGFNQPVTGDIDGDGDIDAIVSSLNPVASVAPLTLYENTGTPTSPAMRRRSIDLTSEIDVGIYAAPASIRDADRNGLLVGSGNGRILYFEYDTVSGTPRYRLKESYALPGLFQTVPAAGDINGDGRAEVVVGEAGGDIIFMRFNGSALERFGDVFEVNRNASPTLVDLDRDGDLDLFAGAENGRVAYWENTGTATLASFMSASPPPPFAGLDVGYDASPRFYDIDADGDLDVLIGGRTGGANTQRDTLRFFINEGSHYREHESYPSLTIARNPTPLGIDHAQGRYLLVGDLSGGIKALSLGGAGRANDHTRASAMRARAYVASGSAIVELEWDTPGSPSLRIVDILGREVQRMRGIGRRARIVLEDVAPGTYFFEAELDGYRAGLRIAVTR